MVFLSSHLQMRKWKSTEMKELAKWQGLGPYATLTQVQKPFLSMVNKTRAPPGDVTQRHTGGQGRANTDVQVLTANP